MNSGPTGSLIVAARMRSTSALAGASRCQPLTSSTGSSWPGVACAPQRRGDALIEHPANRQMDHSLVEALLGELIEPRHGSEILPEAWLLKFRIGAAKVVALEFAVQPHPSGQEAAAECAVAEGRDAVLSAIGEDVGLDARSNKL